MNQKIGRTLYAPFAYDARANDLRYVLFGAEVKSMCDQLGIDLDGIAFEMEYYDTNRLFKKSTKRVDSSIILTFETEKDAVAFRLAAPPNRYFVEYEDF